MIKWLKIYKQIQISQKLDLTQKKIRLGISSHQLLKKKFQKIFVALYYEIPLKEKLFKTDITIIIIIDLFARILKCLFAQYLCASKYLNILAI